MKNKTNRQALRKLVTEGDEMALAVIRVALLNVATQYQSEEFANSFSPNSMVHPNLYQFAGREIEKYLEMD